MPSFTTRLAAALALAATAAQAHMIMKTPTPFSRATLDNSPLSGAASFPCKLGSASPETYYKRDGIATTMAVGEQQTLSFEGSAVHGGGSCQLAITDDLAPSASTSWQVILSIEGGCPTKDGGASASEYSYAIPDGVPAGDYTFAWTWISKLAGQPEYYMNCAPITVTGGSSKRAANESMELTTEQLFRRADLPELFVANIAGINDCKTTPSTDPEYPNPGSNVEKPNPNASFSQVTGTDCIPKVAAGSGSGGGDTGSGSGSGSGDSSPAPSSTTAASSPTAAPTAAPSTLVTVAPVPTSSAIAAPAPTADPTSDAAPPATSTGAGSGSGSGSGSALSGTCTDEGSFNCDGTQYQQCASGAWTAMQALPGGTTCTTGVSTSLWARDTTISNANANTKIKARNLRRANYRRRI
ncbi:hypothetical protein SLS62_006147 [Diatrype stigma]|uniref:Lytic polysaccharide monooxygenase 9 n=1 Tax=Diatrype stigma TaxID=117547 RepID=A0AAN9URD8_9PEZI